MSTVTELRGHVQLTCDNIRTASIHRVSRKINYRAKAKVLDGVFYETFKQIKQQQVQSFELFSTLLRKGGRMDTAEMQGN